jgi:hypothetical protein
MILFILSFMPFVSLLSVRDVLNKRKSAARKPGALIMLLFNWEQENRGYWFFEVNLQPLTQVKILSLFQKSFRRLTQNAWTTNSNYLTVFVKKNVVTLTMSHLFQ